jgi:hypothetical protein
MIREMNRVRMPVGLSCQRRERKLIQPNPTPIHYVYSCFFTCTPRANPSKTEWNEMAKANVRDLSKSTFFSVFPSSFKYVVMTALNGKTDN